MQRRLTVSVCECNLRGIALVCLVLLGGRHLRRNWNFKETDLKMDVLMKEEGADGSLPHVRRRRRRMSKKESFTDDGK